MLAKRLGALGIVMALGISLAAGPAVGAVRTQASLDQWGLDLLGPYHVHHGIIYDYKKRCANLGKACPRFHGLVQPPAVDDCLFFDLEERVGSAWVEVAGWGSECFPMTAEGHKASGATATFQYPVEPDAAGQYRVRMRYAGPTFDPVKTSRLKFTIA